MTTIEMAFEVTWRSERGSRTGDNRDYCGVGLRDDATLCIVLDGATSGADSGALAREIAHGLVDWFMSVKVLSGTAVIDRLRELHSNLPPRFRLASAAYVVALLKDVDGARLLHAGDCLAGIFDGVSPVDWCTMPHTLANPLGGKEIGEIVASPLRNRLTRSFRPNKFMTPARSETKPTNGGALVLATDGFWATLDIGEQGAFLSGEELLGQKKYDDCSALKIVALAEGQTTKVHNAEQDNFYLVRSTRTWPPVHPAEAVNEVLTREEFAALRPDLRRDIHEAIMTLIRGS